MNNRATRSVSSWLSIALILGAVGIFMVQLMQFSRVRVLFPPGLAIAGVPVGQLDRTDAAERLLKVYSTPVELHYNDAVIQLDPSVAGFELNRESMLAAADQQRTNESFWAGFWNFLWGRQTRPQAVPLDASFQETQLRSYLMEEIAARYDQPPIPAQPAVGTVNFNAGEVGTALDIDRSVALIEQALLSPSRRVVSLPLNRQSPPRPSLQNLEILVGQTAELRGFEGLLGFYLLDLQSGQEIHMLSQGGQPLPRQPDAAFSAASIIKIPIMVSIYRRIDAGATAETTKLLRDMIEKSGNDPADWLMDQVIDSFRGPLEVTQDMNDIGLENTFMAGYFAPGSPLLQVYQTPANQRADLNTQPDIYSQTTLTDVGMLLEDIYQCAQLGGGTLLAVFPNEITQSECQSMITLLARNFLPDLLTRGLPEGTQIAHKHGWVTDFNGVINTIGDAGIVYTPGGNYVLVIFLYDSVQLVWEPSTNLVADLSQAVYNYYNLPTP